MSCGQTQPVVLRHGIRFRHGSLFCHQASGCVNSSSAARALCGIGIAPYVATFLVNIFHLPRSYSYLANLEKSSPKSILSIYKACLFFLDPICRSISRAIFLTPSCACTQSRLSMFTNIEGVYRRHPGFCEANNTAVPCFLLV